MTINTRPCGACRHMDGRVRDDGSAFCWQKFAWVMPDRVIDDCKTAERPDGEPPPGQIRYEGERI